MLVKDLIAQLEKLIEDNKPHEAQLGEAEIMIDMFRWDEGVQAFQYTGFTDDVRITKSGDGVYDILTAMEED